MRPDSAAMGRPGPGCTLPPARKRPEIGVLALDLENTCIQPWVA